MVTFGDPRSVRLVTCPLALYPYWIVLPEGSTIEASWPWALYP